MGTTLLHIGFAFNLFQKHKILSQFSSYLALWNNKSDLKLGNYRKCLVGILFTFLNINRDGPFSTFSLKIQNEFSYFIKFFFYFTDTLQISLAVAAAVVCSVILILCAICYRSRRNANRRKSILGGLMVSLDGPSPFSVAMNGQLMDSSAIGMDSCTGFKVVEERPQIDLEDLGPDLGEESYSSSPLNGSHMTSYRALDSPDALAMASMSFEDIPTNKKLKMMRQSRSLGNLSQEATYRDCDIVIAFNVDHDNENSVLRVNLHSVSDLPLKAQMADVYAKGTLFPSDNEAQLSSVIKGDEVIFFDEIFQFEDICKSDLDAHTLRISIYTRSRKRGKTKDNFVAECFMKFSGVDWNVPMPIEKELVAVRKRCKRVSG